MIIGDKYFSKLPKVELHIHLEGAIPFRALWILIQKYGGDPSVSNIEDMTKRFVYKDFPGFIETWIWKNGFLREYDDFEFIAEEVALDLVKQNIRYAEMFYSPPDFHRHGLSTTGLTEAVRKGLSRVKEIDINLIPDLVRDFGPEKASRTLMEVNEVRELGIVGVGLGGSEQDYPPELFADVFNSAKELDFYVSIHAGEAAGPISIWNALSYCHADRIGHGTRAYEDPKLVEYLRLNQIPLEMCPISNLKTGVVQSIADHPIKAYFDKGLAITVNTDDPKMFGNSLSMEYEYLNTELGFSCKEIQNIILQGVQASWLPGNCKEDLIEEFQNNSHWDIG